MNDNILSALNNHCNQNLTYPSKHFLIMDNTTNETFDHDFVVIVKPPDNLNSASALISSNVPQIQINGAFDPSIGGINGTNQQTSGTLSTGITSQLSYNKTGEFMYTNIVSLMEKVKRDTDMLASIYDKMKTNITSIIKNNDIVLELPKPKGLNLAISTIVNRSGSIKLKNEDDIIILTNNDPAAGLYNDKVVDFFTKTINNNVIGNKRLNAMLLKCGNNIPILPIGDTFKTVPSYELNKFILEINISKKNNPLQKMIKVSEEKILTASNTTEYTMFFTLVFDVELIDKFPVNFPWVDGSTASKPTNSLLTTPHRQKVFITSMETSDKFIRDISNGEYNNLYLIFK